MTPPAGARGGGARPGETEPGRAEGFGAAAVAPEVRTHRVERPGGLHLNVEERGRGPALLLLHGFTGSAASWGTLPDALAARGRRVLAVDLPGHGGSGVPSDARRVRMEPVVEDLAGVLDALGEASADWIGYSMGGRVALAAAVLAPSRVRTLVLEGASPGLEDEASRRERRAADEALAERIEGQGIEWFVDHWSALPLFRTREALAPEVRAAVRRQRLENRAAGLAASLRGTGTGRQPSFWDRLPSVGAPTLLLTGGEDTKFDAIARRMESRLPRARRGSVPGAGHTVHLEAPRDWLEAVAGFLDEVARGP